MRWSLQDVRLLSHGITAQDKMKNKLWHGHFYSRVVSIVSICEWDFVQYVDSFSGWGCVIDLEGGQLSFQDRLEWGR